MGPTESRIGPSAVAFFLRLVRMALRHGSSSVRHALALGDTLLLQVLDERFVGFARWIILMPFFHVFLVPTKP